MNLQSLVVVILRLLSLNFLLQVSYQMAPQLLRYTELSQQVRGDEFQSLLLLPWLLVVGLILSAIFLWVFASSIARLVTRGLPPELSFGTLSLIDCYSIVFIGLGVYYIANHFPQVLNWTHYLLRMAASYPGDTWKEKVRWYDVSQAVIPFIIGIVLFVNGRKWAFALARQTERPAMGEPPSQNSQPDI